VGAYLADLRREKKSIRTLNAKLTAIKGFSRWLFTTDRTRTDSMKTLKRDIKGERADKKHSRRALTDEEVIKLVQAAETGTDFDGISGHDRAILYQLALGTGFRASELRSLTPGSFDLSDFDNAPVTVCAAYSKRRKDDIQPILRDLAEIMGRYIAESRKYPTTRLFNIPERTSDMIQEDLKNAKTAWVDEVKGDEKTMEDRQTSDFLSFRDSSGQVADFHVLRHTFITRLARSGISPTVAKTLARHSTVTLTLDRYTHTLFGDLRGALEKLPELDTRQQKGQLAMTGTDGAGPKTSMQSSQQSSVHQDTPADTCGNVKKGNASRRSRPYDPLIKSQLLYQLS